MERVSRHGTMICQRSRDEHEQQLVSTTLANLTDQLQQVRSWLEEKKHQVILPFQLPAAEMNMRTTFNISLNFAFCSKSEMTG